MRMRDIFVSELTVSKRSREYAETMRLHLMAFGEQTSMRGVNRPRGRRHTRRPLLRLWPNRGKRIR